MCLQRELTSEQLATAVEANNTFDAGKGHFECANLHGMLTLTIHRVRGCLQIQSDSPAGRQPVQRADDGKARCAQRADCVLTGGADPFVKSTQAAAACLPSCCRSQCGLGGQPRRRAANQDHRRRRYLACVEPRHGVSSRRQGPCAGWLSDSLTWIVCRNRRSTCACSTLR